MSRTADPEKIARLIPAIRQSLIRRGYGGTSIDTICREAGISKGVFFHHFRTKEDAVFTAALDFVAELTRQFKTAPHTRINDPGRRVLGYIDLTLEICENSVLSEGCVIGALSSGLPDQHTDRIRRLCGEVFNAWIASFEALLQMAQQAGALPAATDTRTLAWQFVALVEGSLLLRRTLGADVPRRNLSAFRGMLAQQLAGYGDQVENP